jgi:beta-ureidopropionase
MSIKAAMVQFQTSVSKDDNVKKAVSAIEKAAENGAKIICLHELFNTHYFCFEFDSKYYELAEPIPGPTTEKISDVARKEKVVVVAPMYEREKSGELYNSAAVIGPNGELIGKYRKMSIPFIDKMMKGLEKYYFKPGNLGFPVFTTPFGVNIGILICYDRHFPEGARILGLNGADIVFVPTATAGGTGYLWEVELRAHAIANCYYVGGVNKVKADIGPDGKEQGNVFYGSSMFVNPKGEIISNASNDQDDIIYTDIDLSIGPDVKNEWGFYRDRRPDAYGPLCR